MKLEFMLLFFMRNGGRFDSVVLISSVMWCLVSVLIFDVVSVRLLVVNVMGFVWKLLFDSILLVFGKISGLFDMVFVLISNMLVV